MVHASILITEDVDNHQRQSSVPGEDISGGTGWADYPGQGGHVDAFGDVMGCLQLESEAIEFKFTERGDLRMFATKEGLWQTR